MPLTTEAIRRVVLELQAQSPTGRVTGAAVRRALRRRYRCKGKTDRVYAILREVTHRPTCDALTEREREEYRAALQRAERAEGREEAHSRHWMAEVDRLRQQLMEMERHYRLKIGGQSSLELHRTLRDRDLLIVHLRQVLKQNNVSEPALSPEVYLNQR